MVGGFKMIAQDRSELDRGALWRRGALAAVAATVINLGILAAGVLAGVSFLVPLRGGPDVSQVGASVVIMFTVVPMVLGLVAATVLQRWSSGLRVVRIAAIVLTLVSLLPPLTVDADTATRLLLALMHPVTGGAFLLALGSGRDARAPVAGDAVNTRGATS